MWKWIHKNLIGRCPSLRQAASEVTLRPPFGTDLPQIAIYVCDESRETSSLPAGLSIEEIDDATKFLDVALDDDRGGRCDDCGLSAGTPMLRKASEFA
jgi:hypothetical protein